ncbi:MAG: carboxypeptidase-like regulatory domain-containing protein [Bacteroidota bacterium]
MIRSLVNSILLLLALSFTPVFGQQNLLDREITIRFTGQSVEEALEKLMQNANYTINYRPSELPKNRSISKTYQQAKIGAIIREIWKSERLIISVEGTDITIQVAPKRQKKEGQGGLSGRITDDKGAPLPGATILLAGSTLGDVTDRDGRFSISNLKEGAYLLRISSVGFEPIERTMVVQGGRTTDFNTSLNTSVSELEEVVVYGKSTEQEKREQPIKVEVINAKELHTKSISLPQAINQLPGVKVRQSAGVGSGTLININGLQGNAIRFFRDDIPLDYLGNAFDLSLVPVDQFSSLEIYKGVLPVKLGADALGGALNFTSRDYFQNYLDVSYTIGSFNTHHSNINGNWNIPNSNFFISLSSYYVYSDNDYTFTGLIENFETRQLEERQGIRFHNSIESAFGELKAGIQNVGWADLAEIGYARFDGDTDLQNGVFLTDAYGEARGTETSNIFSGRYKKSVGKFKIDLFGAYSQVKNDFADTTRNRYNFAGELDLLQDPSTREPGETGRARLQKIILDNYVFRAYFTYKVSPNTSIYVNHTLIDEGRIGSDPFGPTTLINGERIDVLSINSAYRRNISGLGVNAKLFNEKLETSLFVKRYDLLTRSFEGRILNEDVAIDNESYGTGISGKWNLKRNQFVRLSYELATRIPESQEYFGDNLFIVSNPGLDPENSHNLNLGLYTPLNKAQTFWLDLNTFYRFTENQIILRPFGIVNSRFENRNDSRVIGVETAIKAKISEFLSVSTTVTYQEQRRINVEAVEANQEKARLPNRPYFFTNLNINYELPKIFGADDALEVYANYGFTEKFLNLPVPQDIEPPLFGDSKVDLGETLIPSQHAVDLGVTYGFAAAPLALNIEVINLLNRPLFDTFRIPKPGINFRFKITYKLN